MGSNQGPATVAPTKPVAAQHISQLANGPSATTLIHSEAIGMDSAVAPRDLDINIVTRYICTCAGCVRAALSFGVVMERAPALKRAAGNR